MKKAVAKTTEKHVTMNAFEKAMGSIAKSLQHVDDRLEKLEGSLNSLDKGFKGVVKILETIREDNVEFKKRMLENDITLLSHDKKIGNLLARVEKLEAKIK